MNKAMNNCYMFNISTNTLEPKDDMNEVRFRHGLQKMNQKIFTFDGFKTGGAMNSAEVYDVVLNSWKKSPDMPTAGASITCVRVKNQILMSSYAFRLMSYDIHNEAYSYVGDQSLNQFSDVSLIQKKNYICLRAIRFLR